MEAFWANAQVLAEQAKSLAEIVNLDSLHETQQKQEHAVPKNTAPPGQTTRASVATHTGGTAFAPASTVVEFSVQRNSLTPPALTSWTQSEAAQSRNQSLAPIENSSLPQPASLNPTPPSKSAESQADDAFFADLLEAGISPEEARRLAEAPSISATGSLPGRVTHSQAPVPPPPPVSQQRETGSLFADAFRAAQAVAERVVNLDQLQQQLQQQPQVASVVPYASGTRQHERAGSAPNPASLLPAAKYSGFQPSAPERPVATDSSVRTGSAGISASGYGSLYRMGQLFTTPAASIASSSPPPDPGSSVLFRYMASGATPAVTGWGVAPVSATPSHGIDGTSEHASSRATLRSAPPHACFEALNTGCGIVLEPFVGLWGWGLVIALVALRIGSTTLSTALTCCGGHRLVATVKRALAGFTDQQLASVLLVLVLAWFTWSSGLVGFLSWAAGRLVRKITVAATLFGIQIDAREELPMDSTVESVSATLNSL